MVVLCIKQVFIALDQLLNTLLFFLPGGVWADETISARTWRMRESQPFKILLPVIDGMFSIIEKDHCQNSFLSESIRAQLPPEER